MTRDEIEFEKWFLDKFEDSYSNCKANQEQFTLRLSDVREAYLKGYQKGKEITDQSYTESVRRFG